MDLTSEELVATLQRRQIGDGLVARFAQLMSEADLVKFARFTPPAAQARAAVQRARHAIDITRPAPQAETERPEHAGQGED